MNYKDGDEVIVKCKKSISCYCGLNNDMLTFCNTKVKIYSIDNDGDYSIIEDHALWTWEDACFIGKVGEIEIQPHIGVICENPDQISTMLSSLKRLPGNRQDACDAVKGIFLIDIDSYEFNDNAQYKSDYYTIVKFNDLQKFHNEDELRKNNSCKYLYNELSRCGEFDVCKICSL